MLDLQYEQLIRAAALNWLTNEDPDQSRPFRFEDLAQFSFQGRSIPLMDHQKGIRKPSHMAAALSIRTTYTPPGRPRPYEDHVGSEGLHRYKYRGNDPQHPENVALRVAMTHHLPLIWFYGALPGLYVALRPIWIVGEEPSQLQFVVAAGVEDTLIAPGRAVDSDQRAYVQRLTRQRIHQPVFRVQVLTAYEHQCAICRLRYDELLDAAHILPDGHPRGTPDVVNGLALCKIHHAAYDQNLIGVRPDLKVIVRQDIQLDLDGPMLRHGLQEMNQVELVVPRSRADRPDPSRLEERYEEFRRAG